MAMGMVATGEESMERREQYSARSRCTDWTAMGQGAISLHSIIYSPSVRLAGRRGGANSTRLVRGDD